MELRRGERRRFWAYVGIVVAVVVGFAAGDGAIREVQGQAHRLKHTQNELVAAQAQLTAAVAQIRADERELARVNQTGTRGSCIQINKVRSGLVGFVANTLSRSKLNRKVVDENPNSTDAQRVMAAINVATITATLKDFQQRLTPEVCP